MSALDDLLDVLDDDDSLVRMVCDAATELEALRADLGAQTRMCASLYDVLGGDVDLLAGARRLREKCERLEAVAYNIQNGPSYFHDGDDPCWILDSECETVCHVPTPEKGRKLMAVLNAHDELIQEVVRLRYQLAEAQKP